MARRIYPWSPYWESSAVHGINFAIYLASYACFRFMLRELTLYQQEKTTSGDSGYFIDWSRGWEFVFRTRAVPLVRDNPHRFVLVTPDMLLAAEVYLIIGVMLRVLRAKIGYSSAILLGVLLGIAYLTKAVMFPVGLLAIICTGWGKAKGRWSNLHRGVCALSFLVISAPQVVAMSREVGRPSFGENGRIAYALYVNGFNQYWTGAPPERGKPAHAMKQIWQIRQPTSSRRRIRARAIHSGTSLRIGYRESSRVSISPTRLSPLRGRWVRTPPGSLPSFLVQLFWS
jgi:4-amino-4-deoxy-L-arabinose transferase-like glycosyltransferase